MSVSLLLFLVLENCLAFFSVAHEKIVGLTVFEWTLMGRNGWHQWGILGIE